VSAKPPSPPRTCAICGATDARILVDVALTKRTTAVLCGSHAVMRERIAPTSTNLEELRAVMRDRRRPAERRGRVDRSLGEIDELGASLSAAFAGERRAVGARRAS
jgi:hypothetical protein